MRTSLVMLMLGLALAGCGTDDSTDAKSDGTSSSAAPGPTSTAGKATPTSSTPEAVTIGADSDGKSITLANGQGLIVRLASNPSTGYLWQLAELDQNIVEQNGGQEYEQDPSPDGMVGVGGKATFNFVATAPGATRLLIEYRRPWEQGMEPAQRFAVDLTVQ
ncbi:protease inhibitor I42 family protein [Nocardia jejuensis]|uniref:protease inhibitor I42 family protein n=1 Tax=Nocardia jejuensis TaxID=328049 RepID=UPI00083003DE|nr:protease inhibitor I42 family protein [Nocardia jejuensis]